MPSGRKPVVAIREAKKFAVRMGYRCTDNPHADLQFDFEIFKPESFRLVKVMTSRYRLDPEISCDEIYPELARELWNLPFPVSIIREIWLRTRHERSWRRFVVNSYGVSEIEWFLPDGYKNAYARENPR